VPDIRVRILLPPDNREITVELDDSLTTADIIRDLLDAGALNLNSDGYMVATGDGSLLDHDAKASEFELGTTDLLRVFPAATAGGAPKLDEDHPRKRRSRQEVNAEAARLQSGRRISRAQHIVVVDDEAAARDIIGDYLREHGFSVSLCGDGKSLRAESAEQQPDLIVLDLNMPEEDGLSIIRYLKQKSNVPVIMLTTTASPIDRVVGLELGADDYLAKPCELRELLARIRSVLRRAAPAPDPVGAHPLSIAIPSRAKLLHEEAEAEDLHIRPAPAVSSPSGKIFINYRRGHDSGFVLALFLMLEQAFSAEQLFMDVDTIPPGADFVRMTKSQVGQCATMLVVIGERWLDAMGQHGNRRLDDPNDFVRIEIESALKKRKRVIPVLLEGAQMPRSDELPASLRPLARRHAVQLRHQRFASDVQGLVKALGRRDTA
jgi:DNA-binding response OmpR family regulator